MALIFGLRMQQVLTQSTFVLACLRCCRLRLSRESAYIVHYPYIEAFITPQRNVDFNVKLSFYTRSFLAYGNLA